MSASIKTPISNIRELQPKFSQFLHRTSLLEFQQPNFFQRILESLVDGILILNKEGQVVHANAQATYLCQQIALLYNGAQNKYSLTIKPSN